MSQPANQTVEFVPLLNFEANYEILNQFPFTIRKKSNHRVLRESIQNDTGYVQVNLNQKSYRKHRLIGLQFLTNPDPINFDVIDHLNHDRTDNRLENLRWCSSSENSQNKSSHRGVQYEFVDDLPEEAMVVDEYSGHQFNDYYFFDDVFYFFNGIQYRKLRINTDKRNGSLFVCMKDNDGKNVQVRYSKFKRQYDLL